MDAAIQHGVLVVHAPRAAIAVAEHTMALLLALVRHIPTATSSIKAGRWDKNRSLGVELHHEVLGVPWAGTHRQGSGTAGTGIRDAGHRQRSLCFCQQGQQVGVTLHSKEEVLQRADFVTLHASLSQDKGETRRLLGSRELSLLKPGAYLVNCARGNWSKRRRCWLHSLRDDWQE